MPFSLPPAPRKYDRKNENQARRIIEGAFAEVFARLADAEANIAAGGTPGPDPVGPTASFSFSADDLTVTFTDTSTAGDAAIASWAWDFGDGQTSAQQNPVHPYAAEGDYTVILTVTDADGEIDASEAQVVSVTAPVDPPVDNAILPVGLHTMHNRIGEGPGGDTSNPYTYYQFNPHQMSSAELQAALQFSEDTGAILVLVAAGSPNSYGATTTGFSASDYRANLNTLQSMGGQALEDAAAEQRALFYAADEPNHSKWDVGGQNTFSPTELNQCGRDIKTRWPGALVFVRSNPEHLVTGWDQHDPLDEYDALDYCWAQYAGQHHRAGLTPVEFIAVQRGFANQVDVGLAHSLNLWAGGLLDDMDGVSACWDNQNDGSSNGVIVGTPARGGFSEGQKITCSQKNGSVNNLQTAASPEWIKHWIDTVFDDPDLPFAAMWTYPEQGGVDWAQPLIERDDYIEALEYALAKGKQRPVSNGLRTPKP